MIDSSSRYENCGANGGEGRSRDCEYAEYCDCAAVGDEATGAAATAAVAAVPVCYRRPAVESLAHAVDERDNERGDFVAAPAGCRGGDDGGGSGGCGGGSAGDSGGVGGGGGGGFDSSGDGDVASSPTCGRNVEQTFDDVEHDLDNVGHETRTEASATDPPVPVRDTAPPAAAAAAADDGELESDVEQALTTISTTPLPTEEGAGVGTPDTEALTNTEKQERKLNAAAAVNSAALRARPSESAEEGVDVGGSMQEEGCEGGGEGLEATLAAAPSRQIGGGGFPTTGTTPTDAVTVPARRGSGRTPLAKTGGCGSKGQSPALGSWAEEQSEEEEGGLPRHGGSGGELHRRPAGGEAHEVTTHAGADVPAAKGVTAAENGGRSDSFEKLTYSKESEVGEGAGQGVVVKSGPVEKGALQEEPGRSDDLVSVGSVGGAKEYVDVEVGPGIEEQGEACVTDAAAAATLDLEPAQQSAVPEMSPTLPTRTGFHEPEGPRAVGTGTNAKETEAGVLKEGGGKGGVDLEDGGRQQQQQTTTSTRRRGKGGWSWGGPARGGGKQGFGGGGGGGKEPITWRKVVIALVAGAAMVLTLAQGEQRAW